MADANPLLDPFLAAAEDVTAVRPEVDLDLARELMGEAAVMLHNGLALEGLDEHDTRAAATVLAHALVDVDPTAAVRAAARDVLGDGELHEPEVVSGAILVAAAILQL
ncbi:hypothetical protein [Nocardioides marmorisolisilvae]|uniref:Uncharacterized protein n=1 Tax=Nocardioides marmorisolisilvae TaxID=1542737 RepID=A0A3N0DRZ3_9ACTN|nr:hypothetical protein [Nocardioides marmorisolisilvae]RNL78399.1 hypothetical protein EFL95_04685 [Nocardioides marmorisolisilvae]